jgi:hypothetical protein
MYEDLRKLDAEVNAALRGLSARQTQATPLADPNKWSIQQIIEHLLATYLGSIPAIQARIDKGSATRAVPTMRQRLGQFTTITLGFFPRGRPAPAAVSPALPTTSRTGDDLAARISVELIKLDLATAQGERIFAGRRAVSHIILGPLSMQQWRRFHLVHGLHHLKQIRTIRRDHRF